MPITSFPINTTPLASAPIVQSLEQNENLLVVKSGVVSQVPLSALEISSEGSPSNPSGNTFLNGIRLWNSDQNKYFNVSVKGLVGSEYIFITPDAATAPPSVPTDTLLHILVTGQSNAVGTEATPVLSTIANGTRAKMFNGGLYAGDSSSNITSLASLIEAVLNGAAGETICASLVAHLISFTSGSSSPILISLTGAGGLRYDSLDKGSSYYNEHMAQVAAAKALSLSLNLNYKVIAVCAVHGESDQEFSKTDYAANLLQWQTDYEADIKLISGQTGVIPLIACQQDGYVPADANAVNYTASSALLLDQAHVANPGKVILSTPRYFLDHPDNLHLCAWAQRQLGAYHAKAISASLGNNAWQGLRPASFVISNNTIIIDFNVPSPPLVFDTQAVMYKPNYGFEYSDDSSSATLVSVAITAPGQVTLTLSASPSGANKTVCYGCAEGQTQKFGKGTGNLRDSDPTPSVYAGINLFNWCIQFRRIVT